MNTEVMFKYYSYLGAKNQSETGVMFTNRAIENGAPHCMCHGQVTWDAWLMNILQDGTQTMLVLTMYRLNRDQAMIGDETDIYIYVFPRAHCCTSLRPSSELWPLRPSAGVVWADILTKILHRHGCIPSKEICSGVKICHWLACYSRHSSLCECSTNCRWVFFPVSGSKIPWLSTPMLQPS